MPPSAEMFMFVPADVMPEALMLQESLLVMVCQVEEAVGHQIDCISEIGLARMRSSLSDLTLAHIQFSDSRLEAHHFYCLMGDEVRQSLHGEN